MYFGDWPARGALYGPREVAVVDVAKGDAGRFTWGDLERRAVAVAAWLGAAGVRRGDRVGILALNGVEFLDALFACAKLGAILVPYNWRLHPAELGALLSRTSPSALLHSGELGPLAAAAIAAAAARPGLVHLDGEGLPGSTSWERVLATPGAPPPRAAFSEDEVLCLLFTGGTTGLPKAARVTYRQVAWNTFTTLVHEVRPGDVTITHTPMFHTGGLLVYTVPLLTVGGRVVILRRWDPALALRLLAEERITLFFAVPTQYQQLLEAPGFAEADLSRLRFLTSGGAPMPRELREAWRRAHPAVPFKQGFGMTEFGPGVFSMEPADAERKAGTVGRANRFVEARLVGEGGREVPAGAVGELLLRGPARCDGYWEDPGATREAIDADGWLRTGDLAARDEEGFFTVVGRRKEMFLSGGENVYPLEIETALLSHPAVALAAVVGVPDDRWGEVGHAFVVARPGARLSPDELLEHVRGRLARYKVPKRVTVLDAMPLSAAGKILKPELSRIARDRAAPEEER